MRAQRGFSALELLFVVSLIAALAAMAIPLTSNTIDAMRTSMAASYLEARIASARIRAVRHSTRVALRFEPSREDYAIAEYTDGNGNGIRTADIAAGIDPRLAQPQTLGEMFPGVSFGLLAGIPGEDDSGDEREGIRLGSGRMLSVGPDGTATSGSVYLHGRHLQYAVRVLGATGRTRVLRFDTGTARWITR
jgi:prepilin-type N-terminal cleavage/methylation domain-containing protein